MKKAVSTIFLIIILVLLCCGCGLISKSYSSARKTCIQFLESNKEKMNTIAQNVLSDESLSSGYYEDHYYSIKEDDKGEKYVTFDIDSQGMLGGQYWNLIYCPNGTYRGESETYYWKEDNGNNIVKAEKIDNNWWYYWIDYDGTEYSDK